MHRTYIGPKDNSLNTEDNVKSFKVGEVDREELGLGVPSGIKVIGDVRYCGKTVLNLATQLVDDAILLASEQIGKEGIIVETEIPHHRNIVWPTQGEFNIFVGLAKIDEYVQTWNLVEDWKWDLRLKLIRQYHLRMEYLYEAEFSYPSPQFPVAQASVSIYFMYNLSYMVPWNSTIDVKFMVESVDGFLYPGFVTFRQDWLQYVIDAKIAFFKCLRF